MTRYTDLCVVFGPNRRWVRDDYEDLLRAFPEVFLGYEVALLTPDEVRHGRGRGRRIAKIVAVGMDQYRHRDYQALDDLKFSFWALGLPNLEFWHVHRGRGIFRLSPLTDPGR